MSMTMTQKILAAHAGLECVEAGDIDSWEYWHHTKRARLIETIKTFVPQGLERVLVRIEG